MGLRNCDAFCGMGGFSLAARAADPGAECVWAIDKDKAVSATFLDNFGVDCQGGVQGDIREVDEGALPDHDALFGGFPCQPFSQSGKWRSKVGEEEDRDNLFLELVRILRAKQPRFFVFENVENLVRMTNKDGSPVLKTILWHLDDAGYDVAHKVLDASAFGVPQHRERVYFVGVRRDLGLKYEFPAPPPLAELVRKRLLDQDAIPAIEQVLDPAVDEKYLLSAAWANLKLNGALEPGGTAANHAHAVGSLRHEVIQRQYDANENKPGARTGKSTVVAEIKGDTPSGKSRRTDRVYSSKGISPTVIAFSGPAVDSPQGLRLLTPRECARLQGFPDTYRLHASDPTAYKQVGNAVCVPVVRELLRALLAAGPAEHKEEKTMSDLETAAAPAEALAPTHEAPAVPEAPAAAPGNLPDPSTLAAKRRRLEQALREVLEAEKQFEVQVEHRGDTFVLRQGGMSMVLTASAAKGLVEQLGGLVGTP